MQREADRAEVHGLREENARPKQLVAEYTLAVMVPKKACWWNAERAFAGRDGGGYLSLAPQYRGLLQGGCDLLPRTTDSPPLRRRQERIPAQRSLAETWR